MLEAQHANVPPSHSSLAGVSAGEYVQIDAIVIGSLRARYEELGICAGDTLHCRSAGRAFLLMSTMGGQSVSLERDWARYIRVHAHPPQPSGEGA